MTEYMRTSGRSVFWDEELQCNLNPLEGEADGIFAASWDMKVRCVGYIPSATRLTRFSHQLSVMRQLVEWQLSHNPLIREKLDQAWGVRHNAHKKDSPLVMPPPPEHPESKQNLQLNPIGMDILKRRYWVVDGGLSQCWFVVGCR